MDFITRFLRIRKEEPLGIEPQGIYANHFLQALTTTNALKLKTPKIKFQTEIIITKELREKIPRHIEKRVGRFAVEDVSGQCIAIHHRIKKPLEELLNTELYYTIGYVENQFGNRFFHTKEDIISLLRSGLTTPTLNFHTWLTLPSMEIIDYSFQHFGVIAYHADELKNGMTYHPTLVGDDFLRKIGAIRF